MKFVLTVIISFSLLAPARGADLCKPNEMTKLEKQACLLNWTLKCQKHNSAIIKLWKEQQAATPEGSQKEFNLLKSLEEEQCESLKSEQTKDAIDHCGLSAGLLALSISKSLILRLMNGALGAIMLSELMVEAVKQDKACFDDNAGKLALVSLFNRKVEQLQSKISSAGASENFELLKLQSFGNPASEESLKNISCNELQRILRAKEQNLNTVFGKYVANGKLSQAELNSIQTLGLNPATNIPFECLPLAQQWKVRCDLVSMAVLGTRASMAPTTKRWLEANKAIDQAARESAVVADSKLTKEYLSLKKMPGYDPKAVYLGVANANKDGTHHYYLIAGNKRYDGMPLFTQSKVKELGSRVTVPKGVLFKMDVPEDVFKKAVDAIEKNAKARNTTCFHGVCNVLSEAEIVIEGVGSGPTLKLVPVVRSLVKGDVSAGGRKTGVEMIATSNQELEHFLESYKTASKHTIVMFTMIGTQVSAVVWEIQAIAKSVMDPSKDPKK